jgi:hypothetical protein
MNQILLLFRCAHSVVKRVPSGLIDTQLVNIFLDLWRNEVHQSLHKIALNNTKIWEFYLALSKIQKRILSKKIAYEATNFQ